MKSLLIVLFFLALTGCASNRSLPVEIVTLEQERTRLNLDLPKPMSLKSTEWIIVTPDNINDVWEKLYNDGKHLVLFAVTADGYEEMSLNMVEIRNFISTQRLIILQYQQYYEPTEESNKK